GVGGLQLVRETAAVVLELATAGEAERAGKLIGFAGQLGGTGSDLVRGKATFLRPLQQPRQLTQGKAVEDQHRLGTEGLGPPAHQAIRGPFHAVAEGVPQVPATGGQEQIQCADFAVAPHDLAGRIACGQGLTRNLDGLFDDDAPSIGVRTLGQDLQGAGSQGHQSSSFSRFSSKVMPSGSFLSSSLSCAPVAEETLMDTSATLVAGPIPQPSILPIRFSGDVAG